MAAVAVRARRVTPCAGAMCRLGTPGHDRAAEHRRIPVERVHGAAGQRVALLGAARHAAWHRHALCDARPRHRPIATASSGCRRVRPCSCARSHCSRFIPTTMRCSRACSMPCLDGVLVLYEGRDPLLTSKFKTRLVRAGIADGRVHWLTQRSHEQFLAVNAACDVMLDTLRWSGGNTSLDAHRERAADRHAAGHVHARPSERGHAADDGHRRARRASTKTTTCARRRRSRRMRAYRNELSRRLVERRTRIFDDPAPTEALAEFLANCASR